MRKSFVVALLLISAGIASAQDKPQPHTVAITDQEAQAWAVVPAKMDECIGALVSRRDAGACQDLAGFLGAFSAKVKASPPPAAKPAEK